VSFMREEESGRRPAHVALGEDGRPTVVLGGEWDLSSTLALRALFAHLAPDDGRATAPDITIDLVDTTFIDLPIISEILTLHDRVTTRGGALHVVCSGTGAVHRTLSATRLGDVLDARVKDDPPIT
jgi:anti-anti-sigma regulatory factor